MLYNGHNLYPPQPARALIVGKMASSRCVNAMIDDCVLVDNGQSVGHESGTDQIIHP